jgi:plasmid stability protein
MTDLLIRNIEPRLKRQLQENARKHNRSISDEAKLLLQRALASEAGGRKLGTLMSQLLPPEYRSEEYVFEIRGEISRPPDFE